jgi:hypothetical protein
MTVKYFEEIVRDSFGLWISALFSAIGFWNPDFTFQQRKEAFFYIVESLLESGRIKFIRPGADCYVSPANPHPELTIEDKMAHWDLGVKEIVCYLRCGWPESAVSDEDIDLTLYFYELPGVIWIDDKGRFFAS